jgi:hypothetical protein
MPSFLISATALRLAMGLTESSSWLEVNERLARFYKKNQLQVSGEPACQYLHQPSGRMIPSIIVQRAGWPGTNIQQAAQRWP